MNEAMKLGMPQFEIFDKQFLFNKEELNREISTNTTRINKGKGNGSIELFWTLQTQAFNKLKHRPEKSLSTQ